MSNVIPITDTIKKLAEPFEKVNGYGMDFKSECLFARQQLIKNDWSLKAAQNNPQALQSAILNVAAVGISLNPATKHAYLVPRSPRKGAPAEICLDISYLGLVKLATDAGAVSWAKAELVYEGDTFIWKGMTELPVHEFDPFDSDRMDANNPLAKLRGGYCVAKLPDGTFMIDRMTADEILKVRATSKAENGPWKTWPEEMAKKTLVKRASKSWPQSSGRSRIDTAIHVINQHEGLDEAPPVDEEKVQEFLKLVAQGDPLPILCFSRTLTEEESAAVFNSAPRGEKTAFKDRVRKLEREAHDILDNYAHDITEACEAGDVAAVQLYEELTDMERGLVDDRLSVITHKQLEGLREAAA